MTVAVLASLVGTGPVAHAGGELHCTSVHDVDLSPGLSIHPSSGSVESVSGSTITCHGPVNGHRPTGPGPYDEKARYGTKDPDTCQEGGVVSGQFQGDGFRGTVDVTPLKGNCVVEPVTKLRVDAHFYFSESFFD